jgi:GNAT superfamily N-acetyltransferase
MIAPDAPAASYRLSTATPSVEDFCRLRAIAGLSPRSPVAARAGLPHSVACAQVHLGTETVGMGRVMGDGLSYQIVDIAVDPAHQGKGLGKAIMTSLMGQLRTIAPAEAYVSLIADGDAEHLYAKFGFAPVAPASIGMALWLGRD